VPNPQTGRGTVVPMTFPVFEHHHVGLWVPEVGGAVDSASDAHDILMSLYGGMSKGERSRIKTRVRAAMGSQARHEGRFLGGRPPYGYVLADAGPHPNPAKAADGKRLHRLEVDPIAALVVRRIFDEYVNGAGLYAIAEGLTRDGILSPSANDPARNSHRAGHHGAWAKSAVGAILDNPRYTGFEVWNKQRRDEVLLDVDDVARGHASRMRWNDENEWIWSDQRAHESIIDRETFERIHRLIRPKRGPRGSRRPRSDARSRYLLRGLLSCGLCGRRMQGNTIRGAKHYRCRYSADYASAVECEHPKQLYVREEPIVRALDDWIGTAFSPDRLDETCALLAAASAEPDTRDVARTAAAKRTLATADRRLAQYREALDHGTDPAIVSTWIAELQAEKTAAQQTVAVTNSHALDAETIRQLLNDLGDVRTVLAGADEDAKSDLYAALELKLTYVRSDNGSHVDVVAAPLGVDVRPCRRGDLNPHALAGTRPST
jgi:site-specific DNA recombinase